MKSGLLLFRYEADKYVNLARLIRCLKAGGRWYLFIDGEPEPIPVFLPTAIARYEEWLDALALPGRPAVPIGTLSDHEALDRIRESLEYHSGPRSDCSQVYDDAWAAVQATGRELRTEEEPGE